ncbi:hypothetical protein [Cryobacterium sp. AP23]
MITQPLHTQQCNHTGDAVCANRGAGHALQPIQARVAAATPGKWVDGIIASVSADGWVGIRLLGAPGATDLLDLPDDTETVWVWNHTDLTARLGTGQPVAVHALYNVLASGRDRISVIRL